MTLLSWLLLWCVCSVIVALLLGAAIGSADNDDNDGSPW